MEQLTDVEQKIFNAYENKVPGMKLEFHAEIIRENMQKTAYHEAAHLVMHFFLGTTGDFERVSIIPDDYSPGIYTKTRCIALDSCPEPIKSHRGMREIIEKLAGGIAASRLDRRNYLFYQPIEEEIYDIFDDSDRLLSAFDVEGAEKDDWESILSEIRPEMLGSDQVRALFDAVKICKEGCSPMRILNKMEKWTHELLDIPDIWNAIHVLAQRLIEVGEITDYEELSPYIDPILYAHLSSPIWAKMLETSPEELSGDIQNFIRTCASQTPPVPAKAGM